MNITICEIAFIRSQHRIQPDSFLQDRIPDIPLEHLSPSIHSSVVPLFLKMFRVMSQSLLLGYAEIIGRRRLRNNRAVILHRISFRKVPLDKEFKLFHTDKIGRIGHNS